MVSIVGMYTYTVVCTLSKAFNTNLTLRNDSSFGGGPFTTWKRPAIIAVGKTCELRCGGDHDENGRPKQFRLSGEGLGLKINH